MRAVALSMYLVPAVRWSFFTVQAMVEIIVIRSNTLLAAPPQTDKDMCLFLMMEVPK